MSINGSFKNELLHLHLIIRILMIKVGCLGQPTLWSVFILSILAYSLLWSSNEFNTRRNMPKTMCQNYLDRSHFPPQDILTKRIMNCVQVDCVILSLKESVAPNYLSRENKISMYSFLMLIWKQPQSCHNLALCLQQRPLYKYKTIHTSNHSYSCTISRSSVTISWKDSHFTTLDVVCESTYIM